MLGLLLRHALGVLLLSITLPAASASPEAVERGRTVYNYRCYFCHGFSGDARTLASTFLVPPPRDFTALAPDALPGDAMGDVVRNGRPGTAMKPFAEVLTPAEIEDVVAFVRSEFMRDKAPNLAYHVPVNGWSGDVKASPAYPFAAGLLPVHTPSGEMTPAQQAGKRLFLRACISCHDRGRAGDEGPAWEPQAVSYPRGGFRFTDPPMDAVSGASPYALHERPPPLSDPTPMQAAGERLYQKNCAFCHAPDGTGRNWIGSFLQPHPRDLTDPAVMAGMTAGRLRRTIRDGLPGTSMPAWGAVLDAEQIDGLVAYIDRVFHPLRDGGNP